jgi:chromosome segregation ATPase
MATQNDGLRAEVGRLAKALEEATQLLKENARRFVEFNEQLGEAEKEIERAQQDNRQIREEREKVTNWGGIKKIK